LTELHYFEVVNEFPFFCVTRYVNQCCVVSYHYYYFCSLHSYCNRSNVWFFYYWDNHWNIFLDSLKIWIPLLKIIIFDVSTQISKGLDHSSENFDFLMGWISTFIKQSLNRKKDFPENICISTFIPLYMMFMRSFNLHLKWPYLVCIKNVNII